MVLGELFGKTIVGEIARKVSDSEIQPALLQWIDQHSDRLKMDSTIDALWQTCA